MPKLNKPWALGNRVSSSISDTVLTNYLVDKCCQKKEKLYATVEIRNVITEALIHSSLSKHTDINTEVQFP